MRKIQELPLDEIFQKYLNVDSFVDGGAGKLKCVCPFHDDNNPSLVLYDKTNDGKGWDYHCFVCGAHGTAVTALVDGGAFPTEGEAIDALTNDYALALPDHVTLADFCRFKGLVQAVCEDNGWEDSPKGLRIPFFNLNMDVENYKVRVSYTGTPKYYYEVSGKELLPYGLQWLNTYRATEAIYLAEGETDAMTLRQAGFQVLGIGGASTFSPSYDQFLKHFPKVVIVSDNDSAGQGLVEDVARLYPTKTYTVVLPSSTKDVNNLHLHRCSGDVDRFTTFFRSLPHTPASPKTFIAAVKAGECSATDKLAWSMVTRTIKGKADLLLFGDTFAEETGTGKRIISAAIKDAQAATVHKAKTASPFVERDNCYLVKRVSEHGVTFDPISNFIMEPKRDIMTDDGIIRVVTLTNRDKRVAHNIHIEPEDLGSIQKFNVMLLSAGDFLFTGSLEDLYNLTLYVFNVPKDTVYSPTTIGRLPSGEWLLGNVGVDLKGNLLHPEDDGIIRLGGVAYKPRNISLGDDDTGSLPTFNHGGIAKGFDDAYVKRLIYGMRDCFGTMGAWLSLGWTVAGWFSNEIFTEHGFYPYLFVTGKRASGKSVHCELLQQSFGFNPSACGMSIESPTNVGVLRYASYRSSLPQWYDDYRNNVKRIQSKDNLLLDIYNRHGAVKGKKDGGVHHENINGFLLLSGEDIPSNNALATRCVFVTLSSHKRKPLLMSQLRDDMRQYPNYSIRFAQQACVNSNHLLETIAVTKNRILATAGDLRDAGNKAIFAGAFLYAFEPYLNDGDKEEFLQYVVDLAVEQIEDNNQSHPLAQFFEEFPDYCTYLINGRDYVIKDGLFYFRRTPMMKAWMDYHRGNVLITDTVLNKYIQQEPSYVPDARMYFDTVGRQRCSAVDISLMEDDYPNFVEKVKQVSIAPAY